MSEPRREVLSATVTCVDNGQWQRLECSRCNVTAHGAPGEPLDPREAERFLTVHRHGPKGVMITTLNPARVQLVLP